MTKPHIAPAMGLKPITERDRQTSPAAGLCFALFIVFGLLSTIYATSYGTLNLFPGGVAWTPFLKGDVSHGFALALADAPVPANAARLERGLSWVFASDLGPRVRLGNAGWLFLGDELTVHSQAQINAAQRKKDVVFVENKLTAKGIQLLVVVVPDKSRIESAQLGRLQRPSSFEPRASHWVHELQLAGIRALDLTEALNALRQKNGAAFLQSDSHWTEQGAEAAARVLSAEIQRLGVVATPAQILVSVRRREDKRPGDLIRLAGVDWLFEALQPSAGLAQDTSFEVSGRVVGTDALVTLKAVPDQTEDLFGDADLPNVVVIGTSFSKTSNFVTFLEKDLKAKVANLARNGGEFAGAMNAYLASAAYQQTPPKLVIWEIPERILQQKTLKDSIQY